jgi:hypothetical protein
MSYQFLLEALPGLRGPTTAQKQDAEGFAENRGAATLGGTEPASAATSHPPLLAWLQKALILLTRNRPSNPTEQGAG